MKQSRPLGGSTAAYLFKFILFSLIFVFIGGAICALWEYLGESTAKPTASDIRPTVILDPGHGGPDGGATGLCSISEKELNLSVALTVRDILTAAGVDVVMTRSEDVTLSDPDGGSRKSQDLRARKRIAESTPNAIFVSIHMNAFPIEKYSGLQVYFSRNDPKSQAIASAVQSSVASSLQPDNDRKIKAAGENIYLLHELDCPAVLIECGFLSNRAEAERLRSPEYRKALALVIANSLLGTIYQNAS